MWTSISLLDGNSCIGATSDGGGRSRDGVSIKWRFVSALRDAPADWIVDAVAVLAVSHQSSFHRLEFELFGARLDVGEGPGTDNSKKPKIRLLSV